MKQIRIVIADDSPVLRDKLRVGFSQIPGLIAVGEATNGAQAFWLYHQMHPDVLILDLTMPRPSGLEVLQEVRKKDHKTIIIIFTVDPGMTLREACLNAGANYYLDKSEITSLVDICQQLLEA